MAYDVGQVIGVLVLIAVGVGAVRTLTRRDASLRQKVFGARRPRR